jgi:integrase
MHNCARVAESGQRAGLERMACQELISDATKTGALTGFRVQIPTLAPSFSNDKARVQKLQRVSAKNVKTVKSGFEFAGLSASVKDAAATLPQSKLEELKSILHKSYVRRFAGKRKTPKYGSINKGFTELELRQFLRTVPNEKFRLLFSYQAYLGFRIGEAIKLHLGNINFEKREITIKSEKSAVSDTLKIPMELFNETKQYVNEHLPEIEAAGGHIFFKENDNNHNNVPHIDVHYVRRVFRETIRKTGMDQIYDYSEENFPGKASRGLHRLTTHSLRHYAITRFAKATNGNLVLTSRFARHSAPSTTMRYIAKDNEQLYSEIDNAFSTDGMETIRRLQGRLKS